MHPTQLHGVPCASWQDNCSRQRFATFSHSKCRLHVLFLSGTCTGAQHEPIKARQGNLGSQILGRCAHLLVNDTLRFILVTPRYFRAQVCAGRFAMPVDTFSLFVVQRLCLTIPLQACRIKQDLGRHGVTKQPNVRKKQARYHSAISRADRDHHLPFPSTHVHRHIHVVSEALRGHVSAPVISVMLGIPSSHSPRRRPKPEHHQNVHTCFAHKQIHRRASTHSL